MDVRLLFPSLYLAAHDLNGADVPLTIRNVVVQELNVKDGPAEKKPVMYFEETLAKASKAGDASKEKRLVMNKTNAMTIASIHGNELDDWKGKRIALYPTTDRAFGKIVDCIRVRDTEPAPEKK